MVGLRSWWWWWRSSWCDVIEKCEDGQRSKENRRWEMKKRWGALYVCMLCYDFGFTGGMGLLSMLLSFTTERGFMAFARTAGFPKATSQSYV